MAVYQYKGIDHKGKEVTATITAETEVAAKQRLKSMSIMLISLKEKKTGQASSKSSLNVSLFKRK